MELYKKYRPQTIDQLIGNNALKLSLKTMQDKGNIPHGILLTGPSGCGKTTISRIIRDMLECGGRDYKEIDAVETSGVDTVRELRNQIHYIPTSGKTRVYLFDECHRASAAFQECCLKMVEEAPAHAYFIFATTEPDKLIKTLKNRCLQMEVEALTQEQIAKDLLWNICKRENKNVPKEVIIQIAHDSLGSSRAALMILDKIIDLPEDKMLEAAKQSASESNESIELCRALFSSHPDLKKCMTIARNIKTEPESVRRHVLGYAGSVLANNCSASAYFTARCFEKNYYDTGKTGLYMSVFEACNAE